MPAFSGQFDWRAGPIWNVAFASGGIPVEEIRDSDLHVCPALVDTGASATCVSRSVAAALGLEPAGKTDMQTAGGAVDVNVYDIKKAFLFGATPDNPGQAVRHIQFIDDVIRAPEFDPGDNRYRALIGRDILRIGVLSLSFDGHYTFGY